MRPRLPYPARRAGRERSYAPLARKRGFDWGTPHRHFFIAARAIRHCGYGAGQRRDVDVPLLHG